MAHTGDSHRCGANPSGHHSRTRHQANVPSRTAQPRTLHAPYAERATAGVERGKTWFQSESRAAKGAGQEGCASHRKQQTQTEKEASLITDGLSKAKGTLWPRECQWLGFLANDECCTHTIFLRKGCTPVFDDPRSRVFYAKVLGRPTTFEIMSGPCVFELDRHWLKVFFLTHAVGFQGRACNR